MPDVGDLTTPTLTVAPFGGSTAATLTVYKPDGTTTSPAASTANGGATWTSAAYTYSTAGWYMFVWTVTGTGAGVQRETVYVGPAATVPPNITPGALIVSPEDFKAWLKFPNPQAAHAEDGKILGVLGAATEWVEWRIGGPISVQTFTERQRTNGRVIVPFKQPLATVISITPDLGTALDTSTYTADTTAGLVRFYWGIQPCWFTMVYTAGLSVVSFRARNAGRELARHLWLVQNGSSGRGYPGEETSTPMGFAVPNRVEEMLKMTPVAGFG